jgi:hypothetical protein
VHVRFGIGSHCESSYWCAVFERSCEQLSVNDTPHRHEVGSPDKGAYEVQVAMLVDDVEHVDAPQRVELLTSLVRLQKLHDCEHFLTDTREFPLSVCVPSVLSGLVFEDWELGVSGDWIGRDDEFVGGVVERAPESVDAFAGNRGPLLKRGLLNDFGAPDIVAGLKVSFSQHSVRVAFSDEAIMLGAQLAEMFLCPLQLRPGTSQLPRRFQHGASSA